MARPKNYPDNAADKGTWLDESIGGELNCPVPGLGRFGEIGDWDGDEGPCRQIKHPGSGRGYSAE